MQQNVASLNLTLSQPRPQELASWCACVRACVRVCVPSLFAGDTPPVYTAPANAILVVGPCLWVLLEGCAHENRGGTHNPLFRWSCTVLQNVFTELNACFEVDVNLVECLWVCVYMCLCVCLCVCCVFICV